MSSDISRRVRSSFRCFLFVFVCFVVIFPVTSHSVLRRTGPLFPCFCGVGGQMQDFAHARQALSHQVPPRDQRMAINLFYSRGSYSTEIKNCSRPPGGRQKPLSPQNHLLAVSTLFFRFSHEPGREQLLSPFSGERNPRPSVL